ncbi:MAG: HEAT repeat domain-containing protein [Pseudomonadota bacterium]
MRQQDQQMTRDVAAFIEQGFLQMQSSLGDEFHQSLYTSIGKLFGSMREGFNPHNNVMPMLPKLWQVLDDPSVKQTLTTLLGKDYLIHPHRHPHVNPPRPDLATPAMMQAFHKDGHAVKPRPRHREPWWALLFYYPQTVTLNNGPTALLPGTHLIPTLAPGRSPSNEPTSLTETEGGLLLPEDYIQREAKPLICPAGTLALCHFDIGHGAMLNGTAEHRWAVKFVVMRTEQPSVEPKRTLSMQRPVHQHLTHWLGYAGDQTQQIGIEFTDWQRAFKGENIHARIDALYQVGGVDNEPAVRDALLGEIYKHQLNEGSDWVLEIADASNGLAQLNDHSPIADLLKAERPEALINGCYAAGQTGDSVFSESLIKLTAHKHPFVQRHAMSALGLLGTHARDNTINALARVIHEEKDWDLRLYAVQSLIRQGLTTAAIPALTRAAHDLNPYVNAFAIEQLCRIDDDEARQAVLEPLRRWRWIDDPRYW